jgi:TonB family protein
MMLRIVLGLCTFMVLFASSPLLAQNADWFGGLAQKISQTQIYPRIAQTRKLSGTTVMRVKLDGFGMIMAYDVASSSGSDVLDQAAQSCLDRIGQFAAPPGNQPQTVMLKFTWQPS